MDLYPKYTDDIAAIIFSSGTTGKPKAIKCLHSQFISELKYHTDFERCSNGDKQLNTCFMFRIYRYIVITNVDTSVFAISVSPFITTLM